MFAELVSKVACRIVAIFNFFLGVFSVLCGSLGLYWTFGGMPPDVAADIEKTIGTALPANFLGLLSGGFIVLGLIFIALGVFAWLRHIWAMVVTSVIAIAMAGGTAAGERDTVGITIAIVVVVLTIVGVLAAWRLRSAPQSA